MAKLNSNLLAALTAPNPPRALLVSLGNDGQLESEPVAFGQSLLNIETELIDHLNSYPHTDEWLLALRDYVDGRLAARQEARATGGVSIPRKNGGWDIARVNAFEPIPGAH